MDETGLRAVASFGFTEPTPIQEATLGPLGEGHDLVGVAQTGSGKTLAFGLPLADSIDPARNEVQAVVLVPTRELAAQVGGVISDLAGFYGFRTHAIVGGTRLQSDFRALDRGIHAIVGTPGRIIDHLRRRTLRLDRVRFCVLDEADQMLDIGFLPDINRILRETPRNRQTSLFSATMPPPIERLVHRFLADPDRIAIDPEHRTVETVNQYYCEVTDREKFLALRYLYEEVGLGRSLIFRRTKIGVDRLTSQLRHVGVPALAIHGGLSQSQRNRVMADFRSGHLEFLVATNVAARGLDIPDIQHVVNYDLPQTAEEYIHRIGRTARAGKEGTAVTLVTPWDMDEWDAIRAGVGDAGIEYLKTPVAW
ncbi:MAG: DEAD/DEAH box helicase [Dehalococcoidia bacterium]